MKKYFFKTFFIFFIAFTLTSCSDDKYATLTTYLSTIDNYYKSMILEEETSYIDAKENKNTKLFFNRVSENYTFTNTATIFFESINSNKNIDKSIIFKDSIQICNALNNKKMQYYNLNNILSNMANDISDYMNSFDANTFKFTYDKNNSKTLKSIDDIYIYDDSAKQNYNKFSAAFSKYIKEHPLKKGKVKLVGNDLMNFMYTNSNIYTKTIGIYNYINTYDSKKLLELFKEQKTIISNTITNIDNVKSSYDNSSNEYKTLQYLQNTFIKLNSVIDTETRNLKSNTSVNISEVTNSFSDIAREYNNYLNSFNTIVFNK
ncbi:hypothetical protein [Peptostreptococcus sp. D1]|uniref:hypothetical protein n=1 Tax=Peptostreptococcus sp. D1 TaxID=72304 RepID=UPI0008F29C9E|nr:hypothetical protein [Peptostreptococcus sp. D1]SFE89299.1 hypothetical protein SAMN02910278_01977 [Peptostreptococcus sp. D1]